MSADADLQFLFGSQAVHPRVSQPRGRRVPGTTAWIADELTDASPESSLNALCWGVAKAMPPATEAVMVLPAPARPPGERSRPARRSAVEVVTSSPAVKAVLVIEWLLQEGPVGTSLTSEEAVASGHLHSDERWPRFGRAVVTHDAASAAAVPIPVEAAAPGGVLAAFSREEDAFDPRDLRVLAAFGRVIGRVVAQDRRWRLTRSTEESEESRVLNQAVGILMSRNCDEDQALHRITRISEASGVPLSEAARMIVNEARAEAHLRYIAQSPGQRVRHLTAGF